MAATPDSTVTNVKLTPMTMGSFEPMRQMANSCTNVPIPATIIAFWMRLAVMASSKPAAAQMMAMGARLATNIAKTCWMP